MNIPKQRANVFVTWAMLLLTVLSTLQGSHLLCTIAGHCKSLSLSDDVEVCTCCTELNAHEPLRRCDQASKAGLHDHLPLDSPPCDCPMHNCSCRNTPLAVLSIGNYRVDTDSIVLAHWTAPVRSARAEVLQAAALLGTGSNSPVQACAILCRFII